MESYLSFILPAIPCYCKVTRTLPHWCVANSRDCSCTSRSFTALRPKGFFTGRGKHHDLLESTISGEIITIADATGSLILPDGDTLNSVIRVHIRKIETSRGDPENGISLGKTAYFYHPAEQSYLPEDKANQAVLERKYAAKKAKMLEQEGNILSFNCYPNPVKERLEIELMLCRAGSVEVSLWDINGRLIRRFRLSLRITLLIFPTTYILISMNLNERL